MAEVKTVILTAGKPERLKILAFLLRLSAWNVEVVPQFTDALNALRCTKSSVSCYDLLIVADYDCLESSFQRRRQQAQRLLPFIHDDSFPAVIIAANQWQEDERVLLRGDLKDLDTLQLCCSHKILQLVEQHPGVESSLTHRDINNEFVPNCAI